MRNILGSIILIITMVACSPAEQSADQTIQNAIKYYGGDAYDKLDVEFQFRDKFYSLKHDDGKFQYKRIFQDSTGREINDVLDNTGFKRLVNGREVELSAKDSAAYANSVNSVHYFALLPYNLKDDAVLAHNREDVLIKGRPYKTIEVRFKQDGGGADYQDVFIFWFNATTFEMDYFAYSYQTDGGGVRFRESVNKEKVDGVIFQDYNNFKADKGTDLASLPSKFAKQELELLSKIDLEFNPEPL